MSVQMTYSDESGEIRLTMLSPGGAGTRARRPAQTTHVKSDSSHKMAAAASDGGHHQSRFEDSRLSDLSLGKSETAVTAVIPSHSLFSRSRLNSLERELASTPYAFATNLGPPRSFHGSTDGNLNRVNYDNANAESPPEDIADDRFFNRPFHSVLERYDTLERYNQDLANLEQSLEASLFGPATAREEDAPAFCVTQLIHAQDRYYNLSNKTKNEKTFKRKFDDLSPTATGKLGFDNTSESLQVKPILTDRKSAQVDRTKNFDVGTRKKERSSAVVYRTPVREVYKKHEETKEIIKDALVKEVRIKDADEDTTPGSHRVTPTKKKHRETSFAIIAETTPSQSRSGSPTRFGQPEDRSRHVSPFRGRGFKQDSNSRHTTPRHSRTNTPDATRRNSASNLNAMTEVAPVKPTVSFDVKMPLASFEPSNSPRNFIMENMQEVRDVSEMNRERNIEMAEQKRQEMELAILQEMGLVSRNTSKVNSRASSPGRARSQSPKKLNLRSRSNSPSAIVQFENIDVTAESMMGSYPSQTHSNVTSPKRNSKIPKRKTSVSPPRVISNAKSSNLRTTRFISNSTSSISDSSKLKPMGDYSRRPSRSTQNLGIPSDNLRSKPPRSPSRLGPPLTNKNINSKRLSPIVGTPNKDEPVKTPAKSQNPLSPSRIPTKMVANTKSKVTKPSSRDASPTKPQKSAVGVNRTNSKPRMIRNNSKSGNVISTDGKNNAKPPISSKPESKTNLSRNDSNKSLKQETGSDKIDKANLKKEGSTNSFKSISSNKEDNVSKQDNETQYDAKSPATGPDKLIPLTKNNVVSMTTAAIASQPLDVVAKVTSQLPAALEKAKEKGTFERNSSNESLIDGKEKNGRDSGKKLEKNSSRSSLSSTKDGYQNLSRSGTLLEDNIKLKLLRPPLDPQVAKVKKKIEQILNSPETGPSLVKEAAKEAVAEAREEVKKAGEEVQRAEELARKTGDGAAKVTRNAAKDVRNDAVVKVEEIKSDVKPAAQNETKSIVANIKTNETKMENNIMNGVNKTMAAVQERTGTLQKVLERKPIEPVVTIVNEKRPMQTLTTTRSVVKGGPETDVQSSNVSTPSFKMAAGASGALRKENGELPKSTSTTSSVRTLGPGPPITTTPASPLPVPKNEKSTEDERADTTGSPVGRCLQCCAAMRCCRRTPKEQADVEQKKKEDLGKMDEGQDKKAKFIEKINCFKKRKPEPLPPEASSTLEVPKLQSKAESSPNIESTKPSLLDCICCKRRNKIGDSSSDGLPSKSDDRGWICCKRSSKRNRSMADRRDSILSQPQPPGKCCGRASTLLCCLPSACCRRKTSEESAISRRTSNFSKNKSLSPTLPTEDTRPKLDVSLVEHTSTMRGALPALPIPLAWICLVCNVIVPGLGTVLSGLFCLCFGVPRFGIYDGFRPRVGSFIINLFIGCGQLFTVLFCLVGWGWSIWWGVILLRVAKKYRKLKQAEGRGEAEAGRAPPPITAQNHRVN